MPRVVAVWRGCAVLLPLMRIEALHQCVRADVLFSSGVGVVMAAMFILFKGVKKQNVPYSYILSTVINVPTFSGFFWKFDLFYGR